MNGLFILAKIDEQKEEIYELMVMMKIYLKVKDWKWEHEMRKKRRDGNLRKKFFFVEFIEFLLLLLPMGDDMRYVFKLYEIPSKGIKKKNGKIIIKNWENK